MQRERAHEEHHEQWKQRYEAKLEELYKQQRTTRVEPEVTERAHKPKLEELGRRLAAQGGSATTRSAGEEPTSGGASKGKRAENGSSNKEP